MLAAAIIETAIIAPIAVINRAVIVIIIATIAIGRPDPDTDAAIAMTVSAGTERESG
jgi:hypothetical protein